MCIGLTVWFGDILPLSMFGSWAVKLLAQPHDSTGSRAESATRWDFTFPFYSVPACRAMRESKHPRFDRLMSYGNTDDTWGEPPWQSFSTFLAHDPTCRSPGFSWPQQLPNGVTKLSHVAQSKLETVEGAPNDVHKNYYITAETIIWYFCYSEIVFELYS